MFVFSQQLLYNSASDLREPLSDMEELMKNKFYNYNSIRQLALRINTVLPSFPIDGFTEEIMDKSWEALELKARMRRITLHLGKYLPSDYAQALGILNEVIAGYPEGHNDNALIYFPDFVEVFGQDKQHWELSMAALESFTRISTAEFAVRPFIISNEKPMMEQMALWAGHENEHVRRLASEGCRPALPWGQGLPRFKKEPMPVICILELLKSDSSLYVRKSVANNLNDISKTHPDLIAQIARDWYGKNEYTNWIVKHGCRTLLKNGRRDVLDIFGFAAADCVHVSGLSLSNSSVYIGESVSFSFEVQAENETKIRLEYRIDYVKSGGKRSRKIFQIAEILLKAKQKKSFLKTHSFADLSSRKHYPGIHFITLILNGEERGTLELEVI